MSRKISQDVIDLYDAFTHGAMDRRTFMRRLARRVGGAAAAGALLPLLANDYARAAIVPEDDERLLISTARFETAETEAYFAQPREEASRPAVIVIHENRGLNPHIKDVARRIALEGFNAYAVDMLSPFGGTPEDEDAARELIGRLDRDSTVGKLAAIAADLDAAHGGKVGAIGFCWGGGMVNALAATAPELGAGIVYYGRQASAEEAAKIKAALLFHYAGEDARINAGIAAYEAALEAAGVDFQSHLYEGAQHAFNNDTNAARYDEAAADLAWSRTIAFLKEKLA